MDTLQSSVQWLFVYCLFCSSTQRDAKFKNNQESYWYERKNTCKPPVETFKHVIVPELLFEWICYPLRC